MEARASLLLLATAAALGACGGQESGHSVAPPGEQAVAVAVAPKAGAVPTGGSLPFTATVTGTADTRVAWSVEPAGCGSVSGGLFTAPATAGTCFVVAASAADPTRSGRATVTVTSSSGANVDAATWLSQNFLIGVFAMSMYRLQEWHDMGVNTAVARCSGECPEPDWSNTAASLGMKYIRPPGANPAADVGNTDLLAWTYIDEPNNGCGTATTAQQICASYASWKAADPSRLTYLNFSGLDLPMGVGRARSWGCDGASAPYCGSASACYTGAAPNGYLSCTDWAGTDAYPVDWYWWDAAGGGRTYGEPAVEMQVMTNPIDFIRTHRPSMPQFSYIEASRINQKAGQMGQSVTGSMLRAEVWAAVIHGARGIVYFPQVVAPDGFDWDGHCGTNSAYAWYDFRACYPNDPTYTHPTDVQGVHAAITGVNAQLNALSPVLVTAYNPSGMSAAAAAPLEVGWRIAADGTRWIFAVNSSSTPVVAGRITLTGVSGTATVFDESRSEAIAGGVITDDFAAWGVHVYSVP